MREIPRLETARTWMTVPPPEAAPRVLAYYERNRERLAPVSPTFPDGFFTLPSVARRLAEAADDFRADRALRLCVFPRGGDDVIAALNFTQFFRGPLQRCILGYSVDGAHEGRGLLREALEAALAYVFDDLGLHRVEANYMPTNARSGALLRRLGFTVEGYARDYLLLDGAWRDHILTSKTNPRAAR